MFGLVCLAAVSALILMYELGQRRAGFNRAEAYSSIGELTTSLDAANTEIRGLQAKLAILETAASVDNEAYGQIESELGDLQSQISELEENLEFYRGIVSPDDSKGIQIQELRVSEAEAVGEFRLQLFLTQALRSDRSISGRVQMLLQGQQDGAQVELTLADIISNPDYSLPIRFKFRYFQEVLAEVRLPEGFEPDAVVVKATPTGKNAKTVEQSFVWQLKAE